MITILNTYSGESASSIGIAFILFFLAVMNIILLYDTVESEPGYATTAMFNLILIGSMFLISIVTAIQEIGIEYHEAIIGPEVPFVEVMERYEIDDRRGDIWILTAPKEEEAQ